MVTSLSNRSADRIDRQKHKRPARLGRVRSVVLPNTPGRKWLPFRSLGRGREWVRSPNRCGSRYERLFRMWHLLCPETEPAAPCCNVPAGSLRCWLSCHENVSRQKNVTDESCVGQRTKQNKQTPSTTSTANPTPLRCHAHHRLRSYQPRLQLSARLGVTQPGDIVVRVHTERAWLHRVWAGGGRTAASNPLVQYRAANLAAGKDRRMSSGLNRDMVPPQSPVLTGPQGAGSIMDHQRQLYLANTGFARQAASTGRARLLNPKLTSPRKFRLHDRLCREGQLRPRLPKANNQQKKPRDQTAPGTFASNPTPRRAASRHWLSVTIRPRTKLMVYAYGVGISTRLFARRRNSKPFSRSRFWKAALAARMIGS